MANRATVTYNGKTISTEDKDGSFAITYNGSTLATLGAGQSKTLNCSGQPMKSDIVVGGKTLRCKNLKMRSNVVVSVKSLADSVLANNSWATISAIARAGQASQYWKIGDTKPFTCNGATYTAQIVAFDQYNVTNSASYGRSKVGIVFQFKELYGTKYAFNSSSMTDFKSTQMYTTHLPEVQSKLESSLSSVLVGVTMKSKDASNQISDITNQKLSLPALVEIFGNAANVRTEERLEGSQYAFYAAGNSAAKGAMNWLRTIYNASNVRYLRSNGTFQNAMYYTNAFGISPIFFV